MPKWGLQPEMLLSGAWGLDPDLLRPAKVITDPLHRDIHLTELEMRLVDSPPFQRLRRVKQLGATHLVYPGATHTRFSHSLGAVRAAQDLLDIVVEQRSSPNAKRDLFSEWWEDGPQIYCRRVAEAVVLTRLGALLHDLCHIPFGHSIEDELRLLVPHDENVPRFERLWNGIDPQVIARLEAARSIDGRPLMDDLRPLIISKADPPSTAKVDPRDGPSVDPSSSYAFAADIVGNTISADLIDYIQRDHRFTGLPADFGHRFLDGFYVTPSDAEQPRRMALRLVRKDKSIRHDTVSELLKYLRYRYELSERALAHHAKLAADAMVGKMLEMLSDAMEIEEYFIEEPNLRLESGNLRDIEAVRAHARNAMGVLRSTAARERAKARLEELFLAHGDEGLIEQLVSSTDPGLGGDSRVAGVNQLAVSLRDRRLFKGIARSSDNSDAQEIWEKWGRSPDTRRRLEQKVACFAGVDPAWQVVIWLPPPEMRLKPALVLVDDDERIRSFVTQGDDRAQEIYTAHEQLWGVSVFVSEAVRADDRQRMAVIARIAELLRIRRWDDAKLPTSTALLAVREVAAELKLTVTEADELADLVPSFWHGSAREAEGATYDEVVAETRLVWRNRGSNGDDFDDGVEAFEGLDDL